MRRISLPLLLVLLLMAISIVGYAQCPHWKGEKKHECKMWQMCAGDYWKALKNAEVKVDNIENGVIITITADDPTSASLIQKHWAKFQEALKSGEMCPMHEKCSEECMKAAAVNAVRHIKLASPVSNTIARDISVKTKRLFPNLKNGGA